MTAAGKGARLKATSLLQSDGPERAGAERGAMATTRWTDFGRVPALVGQVLVGETWFAGGGSWTGWRNGSIKP